LEGSPVSLSSFSQVGSLADKIVGVASILQLSVPFLALQVIQGSFESFTNMASYIHQALFLLHLVVHMSLLQAIEALIMSVLVIPQVLKLT